MGISSKASTSKSPAFVFFALLFFMTVRFGFAQSPEMPEPAGIISSVEVIGLKRTKPHIAQYPLEKFIGMDAETLNINDVYSTVKDMGILEPVSAQVVEIGGAAVLQVVVVEKWSLFPMPIITAASGETNYGLFLTDTNAFGLRDQLALGGMYGDSGWLAMAMYNATPDRKGLPGLSAALMYSRREQQDLDRNEILLRRYSADRLHASLGMYYPAGEYLTYSVSAGFTGIFLNTIPSPLLAPSQGAYMLEFSPEVSVHDSDWDGFLHSQQRASLAYTYHLGLWGPSYQTVRFSGVYERSLYPGFRLNLRSGIIWNPGAEDIFEIGPHQAQIDILPANFSARTILGLSLGLEKYLLRFKQGTLSIFAVWQAAYSQGPLIGNEFDHGPMGGLRFYLSRLAVPAMGFGMAYNMSTGLPQFSFNVGMGF
jgi:hypothetical protein